MGVSVRTETSWPAHPGRTEVFCGRQQASNCGSYPDTKTAVTRVAWSPDSRRVMSLESRGAARVWDVDDLRRDPVALKLDSPVSCGQWSSDGKTVAIGVGKFIEFRETGTWKPLFKTGPHPALPMRLMWSDDGQSVITAGWNSRLTRWSRSSEASGTPLQEKKVPSQICLVGLHSSDGFLTADQSGQVREWNSGFDSDSEQVGSLGECERVVRAVTFTPDGSHILAGDSSGLVHRFTLEGTPDGTVCKPGSVARIAWSPDGEEFAVTTTNAKVETFDAISGESTWSEALPGGTFGLDWNADGRLITAAQSSEIRIGKRGEERRLITKANRRVLSVSSNRTGLLEVADGSRTLRIWDTNRSSDDRPGAPLHEIEERSAVQCLEWNPDGDRLAVAEGSRLRIYSDAFRRLSKARATEARFAGCRGARTVSIWRLPVRTAHCASGTKMQKSNANFNTASDWNSGRSPGARTLDTS